VSGYLIELAIGEAFTGFVRKGDSLSLHFLEALTSLSIVALLIGFFSGFHGIGRGGRAGGVCRTVVLTLLGAIVGDWAKSGRRATSFVQTCEPAAICLPSAGDQIDGDKHP